jgi:flagellar biosynthetic protein FliQ
MNADTAYELIKLCLTEGFMIAGPLVVVALVIGTFVSVLQTVTSIQEQTLTFIPKLIGAAVCIWLLAPWMLQKMGNLTILCIQRAGEVLK